jgi:hypothetical protein
MTDSSTVDSLIKDHCSLSLSLTQCVCVMMASSELVATMVTLLNHTASHLNTQISTELLNTLMILFSINRGIRHLDVMIVFLVTETLRI